MHNRVTEPFVFFALQRASAVVVQKSLREGFGLTVTEALWKRRPVIASAVGGIPLQVLHNLTGLLVHSVEGTAHRIRTLLRDPAFARRLGENGQEYVKTRFLTTSNLRAWPWPSPWSIRAIIRLA